jgi:hypothetical protein
MQVVTRNLLLLGLLKFSEWEHVEFLFLGGHRSLDSALEWDVCRDDCFEVLQLHLVLLFQDVAAAALNLINDDVNVANEPSSLRLKLIDIKSVKSRRHFSIKLLIKHRSRDTENFVEFSLQILSSFHVERDC